MPAEDQDSWLKWAEVGVWSIPFLLSLLLTLRAPRGERRQWGFIALVTGVFAIDEVIDILGTIYRAVAQLARRIDPEHAFRGENLVWRALFLGVGAIVAVGVLWYLFRGGRISLPKWVAFFGIVTVAVYLALRLMPGIGEMTRGPLGLGILAFAWCLLVGGAVAELDRRREAAD